jgi:hypothetical protein
MGTGGYTNKFYVDYSDNACKQDCVAAANTNCGGNPSDISIQMFDTCGVLLELSYLNQATRKAKSEGRSVAAAAPTGSGKWYVDWSISECVKDCAGSNSDPSCGGLAEKWEPAKYSTWSSCCAALGSLGSSLLIATSRLSRLRSQN